MSHLSRKGWGCFALGAVTLAAGGAASCLEAQGRSALLPRSLSQAPGGTSELAMPRAGYEGPLVLRLPSSARNLGMANAGVSSNDGDAIFYNPGMLTQARGVAVSVQRFGGQAMAGSFGSVQTLGSLSVGVGAQVLQFNADMYDPIASVKQGAPRLSDGGDVPAASTALTLGVGRTIKGYRLGAAVKYAEERLGAVRDGVLALDMGLNMAAGPATFAVSVQNIGAGPDLYTLNGPLPTRLTIGYGGGLFPVWEQWDIGMQTQISVERDGFVRPAGGVELGYVPIEGVALVVRTGFRLPREKDEPLVTGGLGLTADRYALDYAIEPMRGNRPASHRVGFRIR